MSQAAFSLSLEMLFVATTLRPVCFGSEETPPSSSHSFLNFILKSRIAKTERNRDIKKRVFQSLSGSVFYFLPLPPSSTVKEEKRRPALWPTYVTLIAVSCHNNHPDCGQRLGAHSKQSGDLNFLFTDGCTWPLKAPWLLEFMEL